MLCMILILENKVFIDALNVELQQMHDTHTFDRTETLNPSDIPKHLISHSKLVFSVKLDSAGTFQKYKCRLVFRGDRWIDHYRNKTYAGTVRSDSVRLLLALAAAKQYDVITADVRAAFLTAPMPSN